MPELFIFKKRIDTEEIHIFRTTSKSTNLLCYCVKNSICGASDRDESNLISEKYNCLEEQKVREIAAITGREVCGNCIKEFYTTYEE